MRKLILIVAIGSIYGCNSHNNDLLEAEKYKHMNDSTDKFKSEQEQKEALDIEFREAAYNANLLRELDSISNAEKTNK